MKRKKKRRNGINEEIIILQTTVYKAIIYNSKAC